MNDKEYEQRIKELELAISNLTSRNVVANLQKEMSFREAIENSIPSGIAVVDDKGKQVYVNPSFCKMVGWEEDELLEKLPPYLYWYAQDIDNINNALKQTLNNNSPKEGFDLVFQHKTGKLVPVHVLISPFKQAKNKTFFLANVIDIAERKLAEQALKESETKFKEIINQINDIIIVFDEQGKIIIWNKGAERICGLKAENVLTRNIVDVEYEFTPPAYRDKAKIENAINDIVTLKTPERFNQIIDSEMISLDSEKLRNIQSMVFPIELNGSHLFCTVIRDVTEIKRYEKEILRISADKDKFYSVIAQYLYTPFSLFNNFAKLMAEELDTLPLKEIQKMAVMMSKSATNLYSLLDNMLQWTKMNQGKITFEPQKLNFKKISRDAVSVLKPNADEKNIKINHLAADEIVVLADIFMFKTILRNLVSNAIKFTRSDGQIDISAQKTDTNVTISVFDNGIESTPDYLTRMFDVSDIHTTLGSAEEKGTTLGLLLCKEFVEKHGGKIWVESKNGKGNEFKFTMPTIS